MNKGSLYIVGTGIKAIRHITTETKGIVEQANKVFYLVADKATEKWIKNINVDAESLYPFYKEGKPRYQSYHEMVDKVLENVRKNLMTCVVFYGHPGVFAYPSHKAIEIARQEGYYAVMIPGISSEDCLFADLGIDPAKYGCQSFEATDFLLYDRKIDSCVSLILWQVGVVGYQTYELSFDVTLGLSMLVEKLLENYPPSHEIVLYEAAQYLLYDSVIQRFPLEELPTMRVKNYSTLYISPCERSMLNLEKLRRLNIDASLLSKK